MEHTAPAKSGKPPVSSYLNSQSCTFFRPHRTQPPSTLYLVLTPASSPQSSPHSYTLTSASVLQPPCSSDPSLCPDITSALPQSSYPALSPLQLHTCILVPTSSHLHFLDICSLHHVHICFIMVPGSWTLKIRNFKLDN